MSGTISLNYFAPNIIGDFMRFESIDGSKLRSLGMVPIGHELGCPVRGHDIYVDIDESQSPYKVSEIISRMARRNYKISEPDASTIR